MKQLLLLFCLAQLTLIHAFVGTRVLDVAPRRFKRSSGRAILEKDNCFSCVIQNKPITNRRWFRADKVTNVTLNFEYEVNRIDVGEKSQRTRAILLIHPIGVGISRWYYDRLMEEMQTEWNDGHAIVMAPDLLASGTAARPAQDVSKFPLFMVQDWSAQMLQLMNQVEARVENPVDWCIVSNGGCVPIALVTGANYLGAATKGNLTNMVLSATPRLPGLLRDSPPLAKVQKSYRALSGLAGTLFWWYALRKNGKFIREFSEKNLISDPASLGEEWTPTCVEVAKRKSTRYSAFAFLAGALQQDCRPAFAILRNKIKIDVIRTVGLTKQKKASARSWFWDKSRRLKPQPDHETLSQFLTRNGNGGREVVLRGRSCPAYEDANGYAKALIGFLLD